MRALILAAGLGSRLQNKTADRPKALVPLMGKPILVYQIEALEAQGISDIGVVLGYQGSKIVDFISENFPRLSPHYIWNNEFSKSNSSYSFWLARKWICEGPYLHLNCDIVFGPNLLADLLAMKQDNVIAIRKDVNLDGRLEHVQLENDRICRMAIHDFPGAVGKAFGLAKFGPESTAHLTDRMKELLAGEDKNQHYYGLIRDAVHQLDYFALDAGDRFLLEVNTLPDLARAEEQMADSKP